MTPTARALRSVGLAACRQYRRLHRDAEEIRQRCVERNDWPHERYWSVSAADWKLRLTREQWLLLALRKGGMVGWRLECVAGRLPDVRLVLAEMGVYLD